ncbi:MmgE/PrpD family protein [Nitrospira moscoviensis]|uniref:2-methylcitrate dehydratase n=1 Tax=Nitrospira moscoviensis TaxID=42253 RepID=A0A0K2G6A2_NITMO|nr:MmgE/PrpD family protein [Nitrospira moscoviensis]ALA56491.1 2-methylcitrate dehydratase [Nitrospira moscoviensis]
MLADRLARYGQALCYDDLPETVVHEVKRRLLDSLGCALGAWNAAPCRIARQLAQTVKVVQGATLWGTRHKTLPDLATFANGALVRYLDFNDTYLAKEPAHPSDNIAAVLAVGEAARASGKRVIQAIALAYEVQCRLCDAAALRPRGWDHVTYGPISSALAAAKVLKLSDAQTFHAVNLAGVSNIALRQTRVGDLSMWKACAFSNAARNGVFAALLAQRGMTGPSPIFEGEKGFMKLVSGPFELAAFGREGGQAPDGGGSRSPSFKILDTYIKHYPVEYHAQTAVEATLALRGEVIQAEGAQALEQITDVEIGSYDVAIEIIGRDPEKWQPATRETADHSFPYCVAVALLDGRLTLSSFSPARLRDAAVRNLMKKVRVVRQPEFVERYPEAMPTRITIKTGAGKTYLRQADIPLGHPGNPMSDWELEAKVRRLAAGRLDRARIDRLIRFVWRLDEVQDIGALMPLLRINGRGSGQG